MKVTIPFVALALLAFAGSGMAAEKPISGYKADAICETLKDQKFTIEKKDSDGGILWLCTLDEGEMKIRVEVRGTSPTSITSVKTTLVETSGNIKSLGAIFLGHIATLGRSDDAATEIRTWFAEHLGESGTFVVEKVKFTLAVDSPTEWTFTMEGQP
jgi:hypothetical protein